MKGTDGFTAEYKGLLETRTKNDSSKQWKDEREETGTFLMHVCNLSELNLRV